MRRFQSLLGVLTALLFVSGCEQGAAPAAEPGSSNGSSGRVPFSGDAGGVCDPNADLPRECLTNGGALANEGLLKVWFQLVKWVTPVLVFLVLLKGLGVF